MYRFTLPRYLRYASRSAHRLAILREYVRNIDHMSGKNAKSASGGKNAETAARMSADTDKNIVSSSNPYLPYMNTRILSPSFLSHFMFFALTSLSIFAEGITRDTGAAFEK